MIGWVWIRRLWAVGSVAMLTACSFNGLNSLPMPGVVGRGSGASTYHVEIANVGTLESNSPVMIDDVVVGSVGKMTVRGWHADVEISTKPGVVVPANAVAKVGQTSLLGSMHLELNPPLDEAPQGQLAPGATIPLSKSSSYPSVERTLSSLSAVVNGGGLGQIGDVIDSSSAVLSGRQGQVRDLITRLDHFVGYLDDQHDNIIGSFQELNRIASTFAEQRDVITQALQKIPPALDVLVAERPRIVTALDKLRVFSDTTSGLINDTQADLVKNLKNLEPTFKALADIGPDLDIALSYATTFPYSQNYIDRAVKGDYINVYPILDITLPRLKRGLFLGTHWGQPHAPLVPAPGDPWYLNYTYNPLGFALNAASVAAPPPPDAALPAPAGSPLAPNGPLAAQAPAPAVPGIPSADFPPKDEGGS